MIQTAFGQLKGALYVDLLRNLSQWDEDVGILARAKIKPMLTNQSSHGSQA
jgi:hypothetical protein